MTTNRFKISKNKIKFKSEIKNIFRRQNNQELYLLKAIFNFTKLNFTFKVTLYKRLGYFYQVMAI